VEQLRAECSVRFGAAVRLGGSGIADPRLSAHRRGVDRGADRPGVGGARSGPRRSVTSRRVSTFTNRAPPTSSQFREMYELLGPEGTDRIAARSARCGVSSRYATRPVASPMPGGNRVSASVMCGSLGAWPARGERGSPLRSPCLAEGTCSGNGSRRRSVIPGCRCRTRGPRSATWRRVRPTHAGGW
jgi:hypothetical protein